MFITFEVGKDMTSFILKFEKKCLLFFFHMLRNSENSSDETFPDFLKKYHVGFCLLPKEPTNGRPNDKQFREI